MGRVCGWQLAVTSVVAAQLGSVIAKTVMDRIAPETAAWIRILVGTIVLVAVTRPSIRGLTLRNWWFIARLGVVSILMSVLLLASIDRIPVGMALPLQYVGPLVVAAASSSSRRALAWLGLALAGTMLVTEPWHGTADPTGIALGLASGACWGLYVIFMQGAGARGAGTASRGTGTGEPLDSNRVLSLSMIVGTVVAIAIGAPAGTQDLSLSVVAICVLMGFFNPLAAFFLDMRALSGMDRTAFGTLQALHPVVAAVLAALMLGEALDPLQWAGILLVGIAGACSQRVDAAGASPVHETTRATVTSARVCDGGDVLEREESAGRVA